MSIDTAVEVSERADGGYTAVESETGATGEGSSRAEALADLAQVLASIESAARTANVAVSLQNAVSVLHTQADAVQGLVETTTKTERGVETRRKAPSDTEESPSTPAAFIERSRDVQKRFESEAVEEDDVEEAIEWARSQ